MRRKVPSTKRDFDRQTLRFVVIEALGSSSTTDGRGLELNEIELR